MIPVKGMDTIVVTIHGDSEPLVVMEGVKIGTLNEANNRVNINQIKSIEVLKDGSMWGGAWWKRRYFD